MLRYFVGTHCFGGTDSQAASRFRQNNSSPQNISPIQTYSTLSVLDRIGLGKVAQNENLVNLLIRTITENIHIVERMPKRSHSHMT